MRTTTVVDNGDGTQHRLTWVDGKLVEKRILTVPSKPVMHRGSYDLLAQTGRVAKKPTGTRT